MPSRPWLTALGLRGRIVGAVLVTTVATLAIAALTLLGPLEQKLRNAALVTLQHDLGRRPTAGFDRLNLLATATDRAAQRTLARTQQQLATRVGGIVTVLGYPGANGQDAAPLLASGGVAEADAVDAFDDVATAFRTHHTVRGFGTIGGTEYARVALPFRDQGVDWVLAIRRRIDEVPAAVAVVRTAFLTAALAGLALTLILAIPLAATLVRRLRRLRQAAVRLAEEGPIVEVPVDRARDEVGDLARTFATMQGQLRHQEEARRAFVATASHELRTPLTSLDGMLELLDDDLRSGQPDIEDALTLLERARAQSRRLGRLAADLLDLSRIDAEVKLRSEPVELGELSRAVLAEFELGTSERRVATVLEEAGRPVWALGDPGSVARILRILLDNALRVSPEDSAVKVELQAVPLCMLSVVDQGPGVPPEEREMIFERFQRGRGTGGEAGFGLGLAIGRELAERMGGELVLEEAPGAGAKFTLRLPVAHAPDEEPVAVT